MLKCNTLIIGNNNPNLSSLNISGYQLSVNEDGSITTKSNNGNEKIIDNNNKNKIKHLEITVDKTEQSVINYDECLILFDNDISITSNDTFDLINNNSTIKILEDGLYIISYNITLELYQGNKTVCKAYVKKRVESDIEFNTLYDLFISEFESDLIIPNSISFEYFQQSNRGFSSINNMFLFNVKKDDQLLFYVQKHQGNKSNKLRTVPLNTNFNILKID